VQSLCCQVHVVVPPNFPTYHEIGRAVATAQVRARVRSCEICDRQRGTGAGFSRVLRCPLLHTQYCPSSGSGAIGQIVAGVPSGLNLPPPQETTSAHEICY
jgi:hypothetical protein